ncbi:MAG: hypothetical protein D6726_05485, partial [Nitrospirae bacterium]
MIEKERQIYYPKLRKGIFETFAISHPERSEGSPFKRFFANAQNDYYQPILLNPFVIWDYKRPFFRHRLLAWLVISTLCFFFLIPIKRAQAVQEIKMRYSLRESV